MLKNTIKTFFIGASALTLIHCGGSGTTSSALDSGNTSGDDISVASLTTVPSLDLSEMDISQTSASSSSVSSRFVLDGELEVGSPSRAGCETNMHKLEIFRMSQQAQLRARI